MARCKLCPLHGRQGDDQHDAEGTVAVATVEPDDGLKIIDCCEQCVEETFDHDPEFQRYDSQEE